MNSKFSRHVVYALGSAYEGPFTNWYLSSLIITSKILAFGFIAANVIFITLIALLTDSIGLENGLIPFIETLWIGNHVFSSYLFYMTFPLGVLLIPWLRLGFAPDLFNVTAVGVSALVFVVLLILLVELIKSVLSDYSPSLNSSLLQLIYLLLGVVPLFGVLISLVSSNWKPFMQVVVVLSMTFYLFGYLMEWLSLILIRMIWGIFGTPQSEVLTMIVGALGFVALYAFLIPYILEAVVALNKVFALREE